MHTKWFRRTRRAELTHLGLLPLFLDEDDPRPAVEQFDEHYVGGWHEITRAGYTPFTGAFTYPGDPPLYPLWESKFHEETILVYPHAIVVIVQPDGAYSASRLD